MKTIKEFNLSEKLCHDQQWGIWYLIPEDIKEFIKISWVNQCHFIWDLLRDLSDNKKLNLSDFWIEKQIQKLQEKQDKLAGDKLTEHV